MATAYVGLGSNMGDRLDNLARAAEAVAHLPETHVEKVSHAYESKAAFVEDQPDFLNAVLEVTTGLEPDALLGFLLDIETDLGRVREAGKGPRVIDLDLLTYGTEEWTSDELTLPHPGLAERDFVVTPLLEIAPGITLPDGSRPSRASASVGTVLRDLGAIPASGGGHNIPLGDVEWVAVAQTEDTTDAIAGFDASLTFKRDVLRDEGIPYAFAPYEPGTDMDPFGMPITFTLMVPEKDAERARALLDEVASAPAVFPEGLEPEE